MYRLLFLSTLIIAATVGAVGFAMAGFSMTDSRIVLNPLYFIPVLILGLPLLTIGAAIFLLDPLGFGLIFLFSAVANVCLWIVLLRRWLLRGATSLIQRPSQTERSGSSSDLGSPG